MKTKRKSIELFLKCLKKNENTDIEKKKLKIRNKRLKEKGTESKE